VVAGSGAQGDDDHRGSTSNETAATTEQQATAPTLGGPRGEPRAVGRPWARAEGRLGQGGDNGADGGLTGTVLARAGAQVLHLLLEVSLHFKARGRARGTRPARRGAGKSRGRRDEVPACARGGRHAAGVGSQGSWGVCAPRERDLWRRPTWEGPDAKERRSDTRRARAWARRAGV
jgi:hypothetical protein